MRPERQAVITGIGLVTCLGDGATTTWAALNDPRPFQPRIEAARFAPFSVHPVVTPEWTRQISRRDLRQMETWQRLGVYAAGLALEQAGLKGQAALLDHTHLIVAAGGGERDLALDASILSALADGGDDPCALINARLMTGLRPTLFLAQLSNLLAGSISIAHGVVGSSRTFMGEELAGADAVAIACARIGAGDADLFLVGGAQNVERWDCILNYALGSTLLRDAYAPVWVRQEGRGGIVLGSIGCFLVVESQTHATARGAAPIAAIAAIQTDRCRRKPGEAAAVAARQFEALRELLDPPRAAIISAASGLAPATTEEACFLASLDLPVRAAATAFGHSLEPAFPAAMALAALSIGQGKLFDPLEPCERAMRTPLRQVLVTGWGHWRGEAMALLTAAEASA